MTESYSHKQAKRNASGSQGQTEVPLSGNRRLDAETQKRATEVERSGNSKNLEKAAQRVKDSGKPQKILQVPQIDMPKAVQAMKKTGVTGTVKNMSGTKRISVQGKTSNKRGR